jgi:hypothetical protein
MDDNSVNDPLDPDAYTDDDVCTLAEEDFQEAYIIDPSSNDFDAPSHSLLEPAATNQLSDSFRPRRVSCFSNYEPESKRPKYFDFDQTAEDESSEIVDQDLLKMRAMIRDVKRDPSLIFQAFNLPWATDATKEPMPACTTVSKEEPTPNCVVKLPTASEFPSLPFPSTTKKALEEKNSCPLKGGLRLDGLSENLSFVWPIY